MIRPERLTIKAAEALQQAAAAARERGNPVVNDAHLFLSLLQQDEGIVTPLLQKAGLNVAQLRAETEREIERFPTQSGAAGEPTLSRELSAVLDRSDKLAKDLNDAYVSTEHLLLALAEEKGATARQLLSAAGVDQKDLLAALEAVRGSHRVTDQKPEQKYQALERFTRDLTEVGPQREARSGDRPRRGNPARDAGAVAPHQEQPGADRRAGRRQDGDRRRAGAAHRQRRRARSRCATSTSSRSTSAR